MYNSFRRPAPAAGIWYRTGAQVSEDTRMNNPNPTYNCPTTNNAQIAGLLIPESSTLAASLKPLLLNAGYEPESGSDNYICVRDPDTGFAVFLTDFGGNRLELRCYFRVQNHVPHKTRAEYARLCSENLWAKYSIDEDGDLVISHVVCCGGGLHQPNFMRTVKAFLSLCAYTLREYDPEGIVARTDAPNMTISPR